MPYLSTNFVIHFIVFLVDFGLDITTGTYGYIESPNYFQAGSQRSTLSNINYGRFNFSTPQWRIVVPQDKLIRLTFLDFQFPTNFASCHHFYGALMVCRQENKNLVSND